MVGSRSISGCVEDVPALTGRSPACAADRAREGEKGLAEAVQLLGEPAPPLALARVA